LELFDGSTAYAKRSDINNHEGGPQQPLPDLKACPLDLRHQVARRRMTGSYLPYAFLLVGVELLVQGVKLSYFISFEDVHKLAVQTPQLIDLSTATAII
jgi:hypothetical protein